MNLNDFLKLTLFKVNLTFILLAVGGYLVWPVVTAVLGFEQIALGFPMATRRIDFATDSIGDFSRINFLAVGIDLIFWYVVSCAVALWKGDDSADGTSE